MTSTALEINNLHKTYRSGMSNKGIKALNGVSFSVQQGEVFGVLGPNGAGKTTLIKSLLGILKFEGNATLCGEVAGSEKARRKSGYLPENIRLPDYLTGKQCLFHFGRISGMSSREIGSRAEELIARVGMTEASHRKTATYSKGMAQRIGLATALITDPEIIFLDEPTDGLDPVGRRDVRILLKELCEQGKTVIVNSHLLHELELLCDRVAVLQKGEVVTVKKMDELTIQNEAIQIQVTSISEADFQEIQQEFQDVDLTWQNEQQQLLLQSNSQSVLDELVDALREKNISIMQLQRSRMTLEDAFLHIVKEKE